jgi:hypothetical protein
MTREEAKEKLYIEWQNFLENNIDYAGVSEAYKMAFKALDQELCEDAISREDALLALTGEWTESRDELISKFIRRIKKLPSVTPAEKPNMWIPVSKPPEEDGNYIVTYEKGYAEDYGFDIVGFAPFEVGSGFGIWQEHFDNYTLGSLGSDWVDIPVLAWMPLPESYKAEGSDKE